jgi:OmcA/MtrC family decaheme c-type cytochrome
MRHWLLALLVVAAACEGPAGPAGTDGTDGADGDSGQDGDTGPKGDPGTIPPAPWLVADRVDIAVTALTYENNAAYVAFTLKDKDGKPLDRTGNLTEGRVTVSFVLAQLAQNPDGTAGQYTAYTRRTATANANYPDPALASAEQATTEGIEANFEVVDVTKGEYRYKLAASVAAYDAAKTQTVLAIAARTVDGVQSFDRDIFYVGNVRREEVTDASCGSCHGTFSAHGGRYTKPEHCILCHTPQTTDPESGHTVDFRVMIHKIHRGEDLPSFRADNNNPYEIVGFGAPPKGYTVHDFSHVAFPGPSTTLSVNIRSCERCHDGAQASAWYARPSTAACTSCHDTTVFTANPPAPFVAHEGGVDPALVNDSTCLVCHAQTAGPAPVPAAHYHAAFDLARQQLALEILSVTNTSPGSLPTVRFKVTYNGEPRNILPSAGGTAFGTLTAMLAGPTTDIADYWQARVQGAGSVGTLVAVDAAGGIFDYTFPTTVTTGPCSTSTSTPARDCNIPAGATGSYLVAFEGNWTPPGGIRQVIVPARKAFAVTDPAPVERRVIVDNAKCNSCHFDLQFHGGGRKDINYCVNCHNPNNTNDERMSRVEGSTVFIESVDMRVMAHKIHMGDELTQSYILGGNPAPTTTNPVGSPHDFSTLRYPRARTACVACHVGDTWKLPMNASTKYLPSTTQENTCTEPAGTDPDNYCTTPFWVVTRTTKIAPESSVCTSCHDAPYTAAHALVNVTPGGVEACATCHGPGKQFDVARYHGTP